MRKLSWPFTPFPFLVYLPGVPITIELPDLASQTRFNLARWTEILADPELAKLPNRIETDRHGHIIMSPPPAFTHADRQGQIADLLKSLYFDAGAAEVWICNLDGSMSFFSGVDHQQSTSLLCPNFPDRIP
jgi:hypothetical protein